MSRNSSNNKKTPLPSASVANYPLSIVATQPTYPPSNSITSPGDRSKRRDHTASQTKKQRARPSCSKEPHQQSTFPSIPTDSPIDPLLFTDIAVQHTSTATTTADEIRRLPAAKNDSGSTWPIPWPIAPDTIPRHWTSDHRIHLPFPHPLCQMNHSEKHRKWRPQQQSQDTM